jgi:PTH1 family peptidyl-tRNA hydrolase
MQSLIEALGTREIPRLRLGVRGAGRDEEELADYVLSDFEDEEEPVAAALVDLGVEAVETVLDEGFEATMNRYNARFVTTDNQEQRSEEEA